MVRYFKRPKSANAIGSLGERQAATYLRHKGYKLVERNWRCRIGELDLICIDCAELVFVEVKTRLEHAVAREYLFANITLRKQRKLQNLAGVYLNCQYGRSKKPSHRIDVVGLILSKGDYSVITVEHLKGVI